MARKLVFTENVLVRLVAGVKAEIRSALGDGEDVAGFIRQAIDREIARRKRRAKVGELT